MNENGGLRKKRRKDFGENIGKWRKEDRTRGRKERKIVGNINIREVKVVCPEEYSRKSNIHLEKNSKTSNLRPD